MEIGDSRFHNDEICRNYVLVCWQSMVKRKFWMEKRACAIDDGNVDFATLTVPDSLHEIPIEWLSFSV